MLHVVDLNNETQPVNNIKRITRKRKVNGETTVSFEAVPDPKYPVSWKALDNESKFVFKNEPFIIKGVTRGNIGETEARKLEAEHTFFDNMINAQQYAIHNGSQTFEAALNRVFGPTIYNYVIVGSFLAQSFENFGRENCLALFLKVLDRYGAEFRVSGNTVYLYHQIGAYTGFQWRYKHNIKSISEDKTSHGLSTVIRGYFGKPNDDGIYPMEIEHRSSPENIEKFGELHADSYTNENVTDETTAIRMLTERLMDEPQLSQTIDFADLQAAGYDQGRPNEGDWGYIIYEPMDIRVEARIVEVSETFEFLKGEWKPIKTTVTLSNIRQTQTDKNTRFAKTSKQVDRLASGVEKLPLSTMDIAVQNMTRLMQNASTELSFPDSGGMHAISKLDSNRRVIHNSEGIFFSRDGGATAFQGFTADGLVAEAIYGTSIFGVNISSESGDSSLWIEGGDVRLTDLNNGRNLNLNPLGMMGFDDAGEILFQANKTWVTTGIIGTNTFNIYAAAETGGELRVVDINGIPGDGLIASYSYLPVRSAGIYGNFWNINPASGVNPQNLYARPLSEGEVRVTANSTTDLYRDIRARTALVNAIENNALFGESVHIYVRPRAEGEVRATAAGTVETYVPIRAKGYFGEYFDTTATHAYIRPAGDPGEARVTVRGTTDVYQPIRAKDFITDTSVRDNKTNIEVFNVNTLDYLRNSNAYLYNRLNDKEGARQQLGLMIDELPEVTHSAVGDSFALYALGGFHHKNLIDILEYVDQINERVRALESA